VEKSVEKHERSGQPALRRSGGPRLAVGGLLTVVLAGLLTGCGAGQGSVTPEAGSSASGGSEGTDLTIVVDDGAGKKSTWTLNCGSGAGAAATGTHPDAAAACAALTAKGKQALPAVPGDRICTQIYGGPQTAEITGTRDGERVSASFSRRNGCEISRWKQLEGLLPKVAAAGGDVAAQ
jgi:hypothetical protein